MAEIIPLKAWRYHPSLIPDIDQLVSPLFDVVSEKQRKKLYQNPFNSIHLSVPKGSNPPENARLTLKKWKESGVLVQDRIPSLYVYYQYFQLPGSSRAYCRKGFICNIRIYDWDENVIMRHENTMPVSVNDRIDILEKTKLNVSPTHGLYHDPDFVLEEFMDESMASPLYETEDYQGVRDVISVIHDAHVIKTFTNHLKEKQIILADGHHRYAGSLVYKKKQQAGNPGHTGWEGYNYHMMYLTNMASDDIRILPTHRLIHGLKGFDQQEVMKKIEPNFTIKTVENTYDLNEIIVGKKWAFGILFKNNAFKIRLKPEVYGDIDWKFPDKIKDLDLTVMHYFVIEKALGIPGKDQTTSENITFDRSFADCLIKVTTGEAQMAIIVNEITMDKIKDVCFSGFTLPQKSTYFYPKVICGFLFDSIDDDEFHKNIDLSV